MEFGHAFVNDLLPLERVGEIAVEGRNGYGDRVVAGSVIGMKEEGGVTFAGVGWKVVGRLLVKQGYLKGFTCHACYAKAVAMAIFACSLLT